jgi:uncharacterized metal-binding protein
MGIVLTLAIAIGAGVLAKLFSLRAKRSAGVMREPTILPYRFLMICCLGVIVIMLVHLLNLAGFHTGS